MYKVDAKEAAPIAIRAMNGLLTVTPTSGRSGSDLRTAVGDFVAQAERLIQLDQSGPPLAECYDLARLAGISQKQLAAVRSKIVLEAPTLLGAVLIKNACLNLCLATEGHIIADMTFRSRQDVTSLKLDVNSAFASAEEVAADDMDAMTYRALVELHAAITFHLVETARPLPRLIPFEFSLIMSSLGMAHRLYDDASRGDQLVAENKIVHPAFMQREGIALSA